MKLSNYLPLFAFLSIGTPLTLLPQTTNTTSLFINPSDNEFNCVPTWHLRPRPINSNVCGGAIAYLPSSHAVGEFHYGSPIDIFQLPVIKQYKYCRVVVELMSGFGSEESSWLGLGVAASHLNIACAKPNKWLEYKSGWISAGENDRIRISLEYASPAFDGDGNFTLGMDDA